jgi:hypothetical protein
MGRCDQGIKFCSKIQNAQNCFKSNESICLIVVNPTQLVWVQTNDGKERYCILFKMANMQKRGADCTVRTVRMDDDVGGCTNDVEGHMLMWQIVIGQLACDMVCWQRMGWRHVAQSKVATCHLFVG